MIKAIVLIFGALVLVSATFAIATSMASVKQHDPDKDKPILEEPQAEELLLNEPIRPIPLHIRLDKRKVKLGSKLFHDSLLSRDGTISCATCHNLATGGVDGEARSRGINAALGDINSPTVLNASLNFAQFWDGRAATLEEQVGEPITNSKEMGSNWDDIIAKLRNSPTYPSLFSTAYKDGITEANVRDAIATFERSLFTPNSRFDRYLRGDSTAITPEEQAGYTAFKQLGCTTCHQGMGVGGNMFQPFGVMGNYLGDRGNITEADYGRFNVTKLESDRYKFKVPSLRNIELTAPYFHDGSAKTLEDAVRIMGQYQLGIQLEDKKVDQISQFLRTLTGEVRIEK